MVRGVRRGEEGALRGEEGTSGLKLLATCAAGKDEQAELELLDALLRGDRYAEVVKTGFPGVLLVRTSLPVGEALALVRSMDMAYVRSVVALDLIVPTELNAIREACISLAREEGLGPGIRFAVKCRRRGKLVRSSHELEAAIGRAIGDVTGARVDLSDPDIVFRVEVIGDITGIGIERRHR